MVSCTVSPREARFACQQLERSRPARTLRARGADARICADALAREAAERATFLQVACAGDDALPRDVESLLANESQAAGFLA
jgi:hypothetical protein